MMGLQDHPLAYVDESWIERPGHPGVYLLAAVLIDRTRAADMQTAAREAVGGHGEYHSHRLYQFGHDRVIEDVLDVVDRHAEWTIVVANTPISEGRENARQQALTRLLVELNRQKVSDVTIDIRGDPNQWRHANATGMAMPEPNYRDLRTYSHLVRGGDISPRMRLTHIDDRATPGLWLADAAVWSARTTLSADEPKWWLRIAGGASVLDAVTGAQLRLDDSGAATPAGDGGPHRTAQRGLPAPAAPVLHPEYPDRGGATRPAVSRHMTSLYNQAQAARQPAVPAAVARQLVATMTALTDSVAQLRHAIADRGQTGPTLGAGAPTPGSAPSTSTPAEVAHDHDIDLG